MDGCAEHEYETGDAARAFWSQWYRRRVEPEECREIRQNLVGFFGLLEEWERRQEELPPANTGSSS